MQHDNDLGKSKALDIHFIYLTYCRSYLLTYLHTYLRTCLLTYGSFTRCTVGQMKQVG